MAKKTIKKLTGKSIPDILHIFVTFAMIASSVIASTLIASTLIASTLLASSVMFMMPVASADSSNEGQFDLKWDYFCDECDVDISALHVINSTGEILIASLNTVYIIDREGSLRDKFTLDIPNNGKISAISSGDIDMDGNDEIVIGTGWIEITDTNESKFDFEALEAKEKYRYQIMRNHGRVYIIGKTESGKRKISKFDVKEWVRSLKVRDLYENDSRVMVVGSGGPNIDFFKELKEEVIYRQICEIYDDIQPCIEHRGYGWTEYIAPNGTRLYGKCCWYEENITENRYTVEYPSSNGSVSVFDNAGNLLDTFKTKGAVWDIYSLDLYDDKGEEVIAGSENNEFHILNYNMELWGTYGTRPAQGGVKKVYISDMDNNDIKEIIVAFSSAAVSGVTLVRRNGEEIWTYRLPNRIDINDIFVTDMDSDTQKEILIASENTLRVIGDEGRLKWECVMEHGIDKIYSVDLDPGSSKYHEIIITSGREIHTYGISKQFILKISAEQYYMSAEEFLRVDDYENATTYLEKAIDSYSELEDTNGISRCRSLEVDIENKIYEKNRADAMGIYSKALTHYYRKDYVHAKEYLQNALDIYMEIDNEEGILKCNSLMEQVNEIIKQKNQTRSTTTSSTTTITEDQRTGNGDYTIWVLIVGGLVVFAFFLIIIKKKISKDDKDGGDFGEGW